MRRVSPLLLLALAACPPNKKPLPPEPSGRCEVDLAALGHFSNVGTGASAQAIADPSQLIGGGFAQGQLGDFLLENDRIRVVIQRPQRVIAPIPFGGTIIDADLKRSQGPGRDTFGKLGLVYAFGRTVNHTKVEILEDGARGGYAVVAATGTDTVVDYVNVNNAIADYLGNVQLVTDPNAPLPLKVTTYYVLSPGESRVRVLSAFCNEGKETLSMQVGEIIDQGGVSELFNPQGCTNGLGAKDCLVDPAPWFGYQSEGVAYGFRSYRFADAKTPAANALLNISGVTAVLADGENQAGLLTWVDPNATRRPGAFGILAGGQRTYLRDFFVGRDLGEISGALLALDASPRSRLTVTAQRADGAPAPGARITVKGAESGRMETLLVADEQGLARVDLKPGNYLVGTAALGDQLLPLTAVTVPANGVAAVTLKCGPSRTLSVTIRDPFQLPLTAKVLVRCPRGPCPDQLVDYRPYVEVDSQPSDLQAIVLVGADGRAQIPLPPGEYEVLVTRGMEYSAFPDTFPLRGRAVDLRAADQALEVTLAHVVETPGWMSADLHVHAMGSPDSAVGDAMRATSFAAEGVDVLVSTDHDFVTDYAPVIEQLQLGSQLASMIGCEVTPFDYGHHNTFPLRRDPTSSNGGAFEWSGGEGPSLRLGQLYEGLRAANPDAILQMNHPRGAPGGALTMMKIDTETGATHADPVSFRMEPAPDATASDTKLYDDRYDALEVMNGTAASTAVLNDWMTFMSRGHMKVATGVSDTHSVYRVVGGYGRTWIKVGVDQPGQFRPEQLSSALRQRRAVFSSGPFITLTARRVVNGAPAGPTFEVGDTVTGGGELELTVDVQAPEWMQFDAVEVHTHAPGRGATNGQPNNTLLPAQASLRKTYDPNTLPVEAVPGLNGFTARRVHVRETFRVTPPADTWFVAMARASSASRTLAPMAWDDVSCAGGVCTPSASRAYAVTNAILVDGDGSGAYDDFPLKPGQPLTAPAPPAGRGPRRVPTEAELEAWLRQVLHH